MIKKNTYTKTTSKVGVYEIPFKICHKKMRLGNMKNTSKILYESRWVFMMDGNLRGGAL